MVLKFETDPDEIYLVEATGNSGVSLNRWLFLREHIGSGKFYKKIVFRHINFDRGDKMVMNLERFLSEAVGCKYGIGANKLIKMKTEKMDLKQPTTQSSHSEAEQNQLIAENRTFFCSELVAKAFKLLGIIEDDELSCTQFYPNHFSSKGDKFLKLTKGTTIEEQMQVILDQDDMMDTTADILPDE